MKVKVDLLKGKRNKIKIKGLILSSDNLNNTNINSFKKDWSNKKNIGCHYVIDPSSIVQFVKEDEQINHMEKNKNTYINNALYENKPNEYTVNIRLCLQKDYIETEKNAIKFCAEFLIKNKLTTDNLWREFDLNKKPSPAQYLDKKKWHKFIDEVKQYIDKSKDKDFNESTYIIQTPYLNDDELRKYIEKNKDQLEVAAEKLQPDHRGIGDLATKKGMTIEGETKTIETSHDNIVTYSITQSSPGANSTEDTDASNIDIQQENIDIPSTDSNKDDIGADTDQSIESLDEVTNLLESPTIGSDSCAAPVDEASVKVNPKECKVDPIFPDTIVAPGNSTSVFNSNDNSKSTDTSTIPSAEDFEKRQQIFNPNKHKDAIKETRGKPVNNNDPYPVDKRIEQLENHYPKIKIDETNFKLGSCNHPGCEVASTLINLSAMINDAMVDQSKRIEKRIVLLENSMATILRYFFRMSSRMNINCIYYGGQDVFGKYKCIRCLHPDRINDGQSMTMDQCLNCSRYEPIIGQIYDILDESGMNLSAILDDNQMSYMDMDQYIKFNRVEEFHEEPSSYSFKNTIKNNEIFKTKKESFEKKNEEELKNLKEKIEKESIKKKKKEEEKIKKSKDDNDKNNIDAESKKPILSASEQLIVIDEDKLYRDIDKNIPKPFKNIWPKGFVMDWNENNLENQSKNINDYQYENIEKYTQEKYDPQKEKFEDGFKDTREKNSSYEYLQYTSNEFNIDFGNYSNGNMIGEVGFNNGSAIRNKILERAKIIISTCSQGKARYTHARPYGPQSNGWSEWDCSAFTHDCYKTAGVTLICPHTTEQFQQCHPKNGGIMYEVKNSVVPKEALPGDILFFAGNGRPNSPLDFNSAGAISHVGIYKGDNMMYHSGHQHSDTKQDIVEIPVYKACVAVGRPKALVEADKQASNSCGLDLPNNIPDDLKKAGELMKDNASCTIKNMNKYGYKTQLLSACKKCNVDPYLILAMICTESTGNPHCGGGTYTGLMQTPGGNTGNLYNDICKGINEFLNKKNAMKKLTGVNSDMLAVYAYNGGEGTVSGTIQANKLNANTVNGVQLAPYIKKYVYDSITSGKLKWGNAKNQSDEKYKYYVRVMYAYNFLKQAKALG